MLENRHGRAFRIVAVRVMSDGARCYHLANGALIPQSCLDAGLWWVVEAHE